MLKVNSNEVIVVPCHSYEREDVAMAFNTVFEYINTVVIQGKSVYVKPNVLRGDAPERASVTHPEMIYPMVKYFSDNNCSVLCGDSPNFITVKKIIDSIYQATGISDAVTAAGGKMDNSSSGALVEGGKYLPRFKMLKNIINSDIVINIAKAKTHSFTGYSGAVKNLFGVIPGPVKGEMHLAFPNARAYRYM